MKSCNFMGLEDTGFNLKSGIKVKYKWDYTITRDVGV